MSNVPIFFNSNPQALSLYEIFENAICTEFEDVRIKVQKTQISFYNKHLFACVSLPVRKIKSRPDTCLVFTIGLNRKLEHLRVAYTVEPYPGRWTHHIPLGCEDEIDDELMEWIKEAYGFAMLK